MNQTPTEKQITFENGITVYYDLFCDVSVIRTSTGKINCSRICSDNGVADITRITRNKYWNDYVESVKKLCVFNKETGQIEINTADMEDYEEITDDHLFYKIVNQTGDKEWTNGVYFDESIVTFFVSHVSSELAVKIGLYIKNLNCELRITKQTFMHENEELKERLKKSNEFFNHERSGCIILRPFGDDYNVYRLINDAKKRKLPFGNDIVFNHIHNPDKACNMIRFYAKIGRWDDVEYISYGKGSHSGIRVMDLNKFKDHIEEVRTFQTPVFDIETKINNALKYSKGNSEKLRGDMFEIYCSMKYNINLYSYELTESISLPKNDIGADLLSLEQMRIGQCKCYKSNTKLIKDYLIQFLQFCTEFESFSRELYVLDETKIDKDIDLSNITVYRINRNDFEKWFDEKTCNIDTYAAARSQITIEKDLFHSIETWLNKELETNEYLILDDVLKEIYDRFKLDIPTKNQFGKLFSHLYRKSSDGSTLPRNPDNKIILVHRTKKLPDLKPDRSNEKEVLIEYIRCGQYMFDELRKHFEPIFGHRMQEGYFAKYDLMDIFITIQHKGYTTPRPIRRTDPTTKKKYQLTVFEINETVFPNKQNEIDNYVLTLMKDGKTNEECAVESNKYFHRYDIARDMAFIRTRLRRENKL